MGVVYRAVYEPTGQQVALKVVSSEVAQRGNSAERFERESDILKQFRHPNIVLHIGTGFSRSRDLRYYAMEFVPGSTLDAVLADEGAMPWQKVVHLGIQICDALQYAHERGVVHRDLKPSNLMVTESGTLKLTDFGIAKDLDRTALTADGRTLGTAAYMAPEQIRGTPAVSHKTDLYALGCVLFQMLTGRPPFEGRSALQLMHKHLDEAPPPPQQGQSGGAEGSRPTRAVPHGQEFRRPSLGRPGGRRNSSGNWSRKSSAAKRFRWPTATCQPTPHGPANPLYPDWKTPARAPRHAP